MGEEALVDFSGGEWYIGSADATTCLIAVVVCPVTRKAWAAHYNSHLARGDASILRLLPRHMACPEAYLVGSFREASGESAATLVAVLRLLHACPLPVRVKLACVDAANTEPGTGGPRALNLAVRCVPSGCVGGDGEQEAGGGVGSGGGGGGGVVMSASPAGFADRGPELPRRFAHDHLALRRGDGGSASGCDSEGDSGDDDGEDDGSRSGEGADTSGGGEASMTANEGSGGSHKRRRRSGEGHGGSLRSIVDMASGRLRIPGLRCRPANGRALAYYARLLRLPDGLFLRSNSTSPEHEPPHFPGDVRASFLYILEMYGSGMVRIPDAWFEWAGGWTATEPRGAAGGRLGAASAEAEQERLAAAAAVVS